MTATSLLFAGCTFKDPVIVRHPDAPMLIMSARGTAVVAIYDTETNSLIEYGSVDLTRLEGWTIHKYDWEGFTQRRSGR